MLSSRSILAAFAAFASLLGAHAQTYCGGAGYDVSSTARDMSVVDNGYTWWVHPCGTIAASSDVRCADFTEAPYGAMFCQRGAEDLQTWVLSNYNETVARYQSKWYAVSNGVQLEVSNGDVCGAIRGYFRTSTIQFRCNPAATTPIFVSARELETCWYHAIIDTSSACSPISATQSTVVGSSFYSMECGAGIWDFSSLRDRDLLYDSEGFDYWLRMCAYVTQPFCAPVQPTSFCQKRDADLVVYDISDWNFTTAQLYTVTPTGVDVTMREGDMCGGQPRRATYSLQCNTRARTPWVSYVSEYQTCHYKAVIQTRVVCNGENDPTRGYCGGAGYDLSGLQGADMTLIQNGYEWNIHPCGVLSPWWTNVCLDRQSMFCQSTLDHNSQWSLATWNRNVSNAATWVAISNGVQLYVANSGESCGGVIRDTTINFICNRTALSPWFASVAEPATCWYVATIHTEFACDLVGSTAENVPGSTFWSSECGGGVKDVSDIRDEEGDLMWNSNVTSTTDGHMYYLELCGQVNDPACDSLSKPTMFCQVDKRTGTPYSLSDHVEGAVQKYTITENGFIMTTEGTPCGGLGNRTTEIQVVCDNAVPAYVSSLREIETCHYVAVVHGRCEAGSTEPFSSTGRWRSSTGSRPTPVETGSSSSKLSGGAIAGIVIGSIVGTLVLLAILFVLCCGTGMRSNKGSRKFDEEVSTNQSEMEMGETS